MSGQPYSDQSMIEASSEPSNQIKVMVSGQAHSLRATSHLADLVSQLGHAPNSIATALNGQFIARDQREQHVLRDGDQVTFFRAIVGG